jgi:hypothetical protein
MKFSNFQVGFVMANLFIAQSFADQPRTRLYGPLESVIDCNIQSPTTFKFSVLKNYSDVENLKDDYEITHDTRLPKECLSRKLNRFEDVSSSYYTQNVAPMFIADNTQLKRSFNFMNNVYPVIKDNKEVFDTIFGNLQCLSQSYTFNVVGGLIYKADFEEHDRFSSTLGVLTPRKIWLLVNRDDGDQMAFLIDNEKKTSISRSIVSIDHLQVETGKKFEITSDDPEMVFVKYKKVWPCSRSESK